MTQAVQRVSLVRNSGSSPWLGSRRKRNKNDKLKYFQALKLPKYRVDADVLHFRIYFSAAPF